MTSINIVKKTDTSEHLQTCVFDGLLYYNTGVLGSESSEIVPFQQELSTTTCDQAEHATKSGNFKRYIYY